MSSKMALQASQSRIMPASTSVKQIPAPEKSSVQLGAASAAFVPLPRKVSAAEQSLLQLVSATASAAHVPLSAQATQRSSIARGARASWIRQYDQMPAIPAGGAQKSEKNMDKKRGKQGEKSARNRRRLY